MNGNKKNKLLAYSLCALQAFIGLTAIMGGFGLVSDPSGAKSHLPLEWLGNSPFTDYFIPGLVLLVVIGVGNVLAGTVTFLRSRYTGITAVVLGTFLILYMLVEVAFVGLRNFMQPLYFILGVLVLILGLSLTGLFFCSEQDPVGMNIHPSCERR